MNEIIATIIENCIDYDNNKDLLDALYDNGNYSVFGWTILSVSFVSLLIFYRFWDPIAKQTIKYILTILGAAIMVGIITYSIIWNNSDILDLDGNFNESSYYMDPVLFVYLVSLIIAGVSIVLSLILSVLVKNISISNKHNPF